MSKTNADRVSWGHALIFWALVVQLANSLLGELAIRYLFEQRVDDLGFDEVRSLVDTIFIVRSSIYFLSASAALTGISLLLSASLVRSTRTWLTVALVALIPWLAAMLVGLLAEMDVMEPSMSLFKWMWRLIGLAMIVHTAALVMALAGRARAAEIPFATGLGIAAVALGAVAWGLPALVRWSEWLQNLAYVEYRDEYRAFDQFVSIGSTGCLLALIPRGNPSVNDTAGSGIDWERAASGLDGFASAILARVWIALAAAAGLLFGFMARSVDLLKMVAFLIPIATTIATAMMVAGTTGFRRLPWPPAAASAARAALVLFCLILALESWAVYQVYELLSGSLRPSQLEDSMTANAGVQGLFLFGLLLMLSAMSRVGQSLAEDAMLRTGSSLIVPVTVVFIGAALLQYPAVLRELVSSPEGALSMMLLAAIAVLTVIVSCAKFAREVSAVIRTYADTAPPAARVVNTERAPTDD